MPTRNIIKIDESKCNGCGLCIPNCREGALCIIDGKARLVGDALCDGLGACLGHCPQGAITIEQRPAAAFDEDAVRKHKAAEQKPLPCGCPGGVVKSFARPAGSACAPVKNQPSELQQWPVQLRLVPPNAPYLAGSDLLVCADCVPFACADFHQRLLRGRTVVAACPKLDDPQVYAQKLSQIIAANDFKSITYARMEVPCCAGLAAVIRQALAACGKAHIPYKEEIITIQGA